MKSLEWQDLELLKSCLLSGAILACSIQCRLIQIREHEKGDRSQCARSKACGSYQNSVKKPVADSIGILAWYVDGEFLWSMAKD